MSRVALTVAISMFLVAGCQSSVKSHKAGPEWVSNMHRLSGAHLRLMPVAADGKRFADPNERQMIVSNLNEMATAASRIVHDDKAPDADPLIKFSATRFAIEIKQAGQALHMGDLQGARHSLQRANGYCVSCHTRLDRGAKDFDLAWTPQLSGLNSAQRVDFLLANRRYSSATEEAMRLAADETLVKQDPRAWLVSLERVLAMLVRVKSERQQAETIVRAVVKNKSAPYYIRSDAGMWLRDIQEWHKEKPLAKNASRVQAALKLMEKAERYGSKSRAGLITNLRASALLHEALEDSQGPRYGDALLYAGLVAQSLSDLNQGFLDQYYFERCIRHQPHTEVAEQCYSLYERSIYDSNPFMELEPDSAWSVRNKLTDLRQEANFKDPLDNPRWHGRPWEKEIR